MRPSEAFTRAEDLIPGGSFRLAAQEKQTSSVSLKSDQLNPILCRTKMIAACIYVLFSHGLTSEVIRRPLLI